LKNLLFIGIILGLFSCTNEEKDPISIACHGLDLDATSLELTEAFVLDSIQFSSSKTNYLLRGTIRYKDEDHSFSIITNGSPKSEGFVIERQNFPLKSIDSSDFDCVLTYRKGVCEITWRNNTSSLYLRSSISEAR